MKDAILTLLINFALISSIKSKSETETTIVIKPGIQDYAAPFDLHAQSFKELLKKNKIFVDNSLFIKETLGHRVSIYITGPRRCGKTINLDMMKTFLEIQVDDRGNRILPKNATSNYKLFVNGEIPTDNGTTLKLDKPLAISRHQDIIDLHLGEHPVIYVNFRDARGNNLEEIEQSMRHDIRQAFQQHQYMINILNDAVKSNNRSRSEKAKQHLQTFTNVLNNLTDTDNLGHSIQILHQMLRDHFGRNPIIIYDDFDKPLTNILLLRSFPREDVSEIMRSLDRLIVLSIRSGGFVNRRHRLFIAGVHAPQRPPSAPWINHTRIDLLLDSKYSIIRRFGIDDRDLQRLYEVLKIPANLSAQTLDWYGSGGDHHRNLFSILSFLNTKKIALYFTDEEADSVITPLLNASRDARDTILSLLSNAEVTTSMLSLYRKIQEIELFKLKPQLFNPTASYDCLADAVFTWYLIRKGYFGIRRLTEAQYEANPLQHEIKVLPPNKEIATLACSWLISYHQRKYNITERSLENASSSFLHFLNDDAYSISELEGHLKHLYQSKSQFLPPSETTGRDDGVEDPYQALFTSVALKMQHTTHLDVQVSYPYRESLNYALLDRRTDRAIILQISCNEASVDKIFTSVQDHVPRALQKLNNPKMVRLAVLKIWPNSTVRIHAKRYERNCNDTVPHFEEVDDRI